jgi:hypothetical protein
VTDAPHPRILFHEVPSEVPLDQLTALASTYQVITEADAGIHVSDWDLLVTFAESTHLQRQFHTLSFGGIRFPNIRDSGLLKAPARNQRLSARSAYVAEGIKNHELRSLLQRSIVDNDPGPAKRDGLLDLPAGSYHMVDVGDEQRPWAAVLKYPTKLIWALPPETTSHTEWLQYVLRTLHGLDPAIFPAEPDWRVGGPWSTPKIDKALQEIQAIADERDALLDQLAQRESLAKQELLLVSAAAAVAEQKLLTSQGDELVDAVSSVLVSFGFRVQDMDDHHEAVTGAKLEDLRAQPDEPKALPWICLIEVKGYSKGAKVNDLGQIYGRPVVNYVRDVGREPDAVWHVVNSWLGRRPDVRPLAFPGQDDLVTLSANKGTFIDTRHLFHAWKDVATGQVAAEVVRDSLMSTTGRWVWPLR